MGRVLDVVVVMGTILEGCSNPDAAKDRTYLAGTPATTAANARPAAVPGTATIIGECAIGAIPTGACPPGSACNGVFGNAVLYPAGTSLHPLAIADLDGNGKLDVVVGISGGKIAVLLGTGAGVLGTAASYTLGGSITELAIADFDGDTKLDVAASTGGDVRVLPGVGNGTFGTTPKITSVAAGGIA